MLPVRSLLALFALAGTLLWPCAPAAHAERLAIQGAGSDAVAPADQAPASPPATGGPEGGVVEYTVQSGDTLYGIADKYHIGVETIIWANNLDSNPDMLHLDQKLLIPPVDGVLHIVKSGDTLSAIATRYNAKVDDIRNLPSNSLQDENALLQPGQRIVVPGGTRPKPAPPAPKPAPAPAAPAQAAAPAAPAAEAPTATGPATGHFIWPVTGRILQSYHPYHRALDIESPIGTPIKAADNGTVVFSGWSNDGYGYHVIIDHGNGYRTLYAHMNRLDVKAGQAVAQGQSIGIVGMTGRTTGPHLHFELVQNGVQINAAGALG
jgi:murein DD-endopeptidase MepM/ murein hydrolase activator NlpD